MRISVVYNRNFWGVILCKEAGEDTIFSRVLLTSYSIPSGKGFEDRSRTMAVGTLVEFCIHQLKMCQQDHFLISRELHKCFVFLSLEPKAIHSSWNSPRLEFWNILLQKFPLLFTFPQHQKISIHPQDAFGRPKELILRHSLWFGVLSPEAEYGMALTFHKNYTQVKMLCSFETCMARNSTKIKAEVILRWWILFIFSLNCIHITGLIKFPEQQKIIVRREEILRF